MSISYWLTPEERSQFHRWITTESHLFELSIDFRSKLVFWFCYQALQWQIPLSIILQSILMFDHYLYTKCKHYLHVPHQNFPCYLLICFHICWKFEMDDNPEKEAITRSLLMSTSQTFFFTTPSCSLRLDQLWNLWEWDIFVTECSYLSVVNSSSYFSLPLIEDVLDGRYLLDGRTRPTQPSSL